MAYGKQSHPRQDHQRNQRYSHSDSDFGGNNEYQGHREETHRPKSFAPKSATARVDYRPNNYLRSDRSTDRQGRSNNPDSGFQKKIFTQSKIAEIHASLPTSKNFAPIGKTAEVMRGLYDGCAVPMFLYGFEDFGPDSYTSTFELASRVNRFLQNPVPPREISEREFIRTHSFPNDYGILSIETSGVFLPSCIVFTNIVLRTINGNVNFESFVGGHLQKPSIQKNFMFHLAMGLYDAEMADSKHYETVNSFVTQIKGNDDDVRAVRALFSLADASSVIPYKERLDKFEAALSCVKDPEPYQPLIFDVKEKVS